MESFSNNILLSNLIKIRWIAISGQLFTILLVYFYLDINIGIIPCLLIVFVSSIINIHSYFSKKITNYLSDKEAFYFLIFDTIQLGILLFLTGGIYNPFSILLIAPLIISASYLPIVFSIWLLILSVCCVILISFFYIPIIWNEEFIVPIFFTYGLSFSLIISLIFIAIYVYLFASSYRGISDALVQTRVVLENQKKISAVGSLSAAAAHELSTPLNTIYLILNDLNENKDVNNNIEIKKEIELLKSQTDRCRNILLTLSKNPQDLNDSFLNKTTVSNLIKVSFNKFNRKNIKLIVNIKDKNNEPTIFYKDEIVYALGNIIQNSIQHSKNEVLIEINWNEKDFFIKIIDDGKGFEVETLDQIGKPYISNTEKGMGLGIFIAINLIDSIGGSISFKNQKNVGAVVEFTIKRVT